MENPARQYGFTLVELVVALAILGILVGIGLPSFKSAVSNSRISSQYNDTISAFFLARSEAVKGSGKVTACARSANQEKTCKGTGGDWSHGIVVFQDNAPAVSDGNVTIGANDEVLYVEPALSGDNTLSLRGSSNNTAAEARSRSFVTYKPNGSTNWRGVALTLCDSEGASDPRAINIVLTGDIRRGREPSNGSNALDTFGVPVHCP